MKWPRRKRRWSQPDVEQALATLARDQAEHPNEFTWYAHSAEEAEEMRERYAELGRSVRVVRLKQ